MRDKLEALLDIEGVEAALIVLGSIVAAFLTEVIIRHTILAFAKKTKTDIDDKIVELLRRPIFLSVIFFGLGLATPTLHPPKDAAFLVDATLKTLALIIWSAAAFGIGNVLLQAVSGRARKNSIIHPQTLPVFDMLLKMVVIGSAIYFGFLAWDIDVTAWLASAGIIGIAVGFAAKDTLANLFSGIFIVADAPYKVKDWIVLDGDLRGEVTKIGIRSTRILTEDDIEITVPNAVIGGSKIINERGGRHIKQRISIHVQCAYGSDIDQVREVLLECPKHHELVCSYPQPDVRFTAFGGSGLDFTLLVWIEDAAKKNKIIDDLNCRVYKKFNENGIEIPYSKLDLYIKEQVAAAQQPQP